MGGCGRNENQKKRKGRERGLTDIISFHFNQRKRRRRGRRMSHRHSGGGGDGGVMKPFPKRF
jgi:hypothetical protein